MAPAGLKFGETLGLTNRGPPIKEKICQYQMQSQNKER